MINFDSDYSIRLAQLQALGGDATQHYDSLYEIDLAILAAIQGGGGGGGAAIDDNNVSTRTTYSSSKITQLLADAGFDTEIVETLPETGDIHTIYFKASADPQTQNTYDEFMYISGAWEQVGSTAIDLSGYYTKALTDTLVENKPDYVEITQDEYDLLSSTEKNNGSVYIITDATVVDPADYYTKTQADNAFNPKNTVTASSGSYKFPNWNARGQITGSAATAYQASQSVNGSSRTLYSTSSTSLPTIYAPTSAGTSGQYLVSNGSGAPSWQTLEVASDYVVADSDAIAGTYSTDIAAFYTKTMSEEIVLGVQIKITDTHIINGLPINSLSDDDTFLVEAGQTATITVTDGNEDTHTISIAADGTITDSDSTGCVTADSTLSITGYYAYTFSTVSSTYTFTSVTGTIYGTDTATSDSFYLPSSSRIFENYVELWLMYTEDGATWTNIHYLITSNSISRDVTNGTFGPANS